MKIGSIVYLAQKQRIRLLAGIVRMVMPFYRLIFVESAASSGLLKALADGPRTLEQIEEQQGYSPKMRGTLETWLQLGVKLGELKRDERGFALNSYLSRKLVEVENDDLLAYLEEAVSLHHRLFSELPARLREGRQFTLADQDGEVIARSSRMLEPFVVQAIKKVVPKVGPVHLLEIGCGSGTYLRYASERNSSLTAVGLELQEVVAEAARKNLTEWEVGERVSVEHGDVREREPEPLFDLATMHNNIYYFPFEERVEVLSHVRGFLKPGGRLLITTACDGNDPGISVLSLWGSATEGCGRLPTPDEMIAQLKEAGFEPVQAIKLLVGDNYFGFVGVNG